MQRAAGFLWASNKRAIAKTNMQNLYIISASGKTNYEN
jgi:hypothetical protein